MHMNKPLRADSVSYALAEFPELNTKPQFFDEIVDVKEGATLTLEAKEGEPGIFSLSS
jgi:hypothetical protein